MSERKEVFGGCHCGSVRFKAQVEEPLIVKNCNCSICDKNGFMHLIVPKVYFELLSGQEMLTEYTFNTRVAKHLFCKRCGIESFYVPRSNPDGYSVNYRCLDDYQQFTADVSDFDGQNWEKHAGKIAHLSKA